MALARREYKFLIDERTADRVRAALAGLCIGDLHAAATGGRYTCDTLYLDTLAMNLYRATIENEAVRYKLRVRMYPGGASPVFLEVKRRVDDVIVKSRAAIRGDWRSILETGDLTAVPEDQRRAAENFVTYYQTSRGGPLVPTVLVRYEREPYTSLVDDYVRITFDRKLSYRAATELAFDPDARSWTPIDDPVAMRVAPAHSAVVLELKFSATVPRWLGQIVRRLELARLSYCKYTRAVDSMLHRPLSRARIE
jgi:hypothetical protein